MSRKLLVLGIALIVALTPTTRVLAFSQSQGEHAHDLDAWQRDLPDGVELVSSEEVAPGHLKVQLKINGESFTTEIKRGEQARQHIAQKKKEYDKKRKAFDKAASGMLKHGVPLPDQEIVVRFYRAAGASPVASQGVSSPEGEIYFNSSDDGDPRTWKGTAYVEDYGDKSWAVYNMKVKTTRQPPKVMMANKIDAGVGGGNPRISYDGPHSIVQPRAAVAAIGLPRTEAAGVLGAAATQKDKNNWKGFFFCLAYGLLVDFASCAGTGFMFPACMFLLVGWTAVICALGEGLSRG